MTKNNTRLIAVLLVLVAVYAIFFTDWFKTKTIKMFYTTREIGHFRPHDLPYILFGLEGRYKLTEIKVVSADDLQRNPGAPPEWHLIADPDSVPIKMFVYGQRIHGMKPAIEGEEAQDLQTNVVYRLFVTAGRIHGQMDFKLK